jgi:hypothetical protein
MPDSLPDLESRRARLLAQFAALGDLRSGSITNTSGRCGKPNCRCHKPGNPAHGPNPRLTFKHQGKTVTESLPTPAAQHKAEREIAEFRRFEQLIRDFVEVNARICRARPVEDSLTPEEKKRPRRSRTRSRAK